jgi:uncharacterized protein with HEPN domain
MSKRSSAVLLVDILDAMNKIIQYVSGYTLETFVRDTRTVDAVVRNLEVIGEASQRLPEDFKTSHPSIPWTAMAGLRNRIAHEYFGVVESIIWKTASEDLEPLIQDIAAILEAEKADTGVSW